MIYIFIIALKIYNNKIPKKENVLQKISQEIDTKNFFRNFEILPLKHRFPKDRSFSFY